MAQMPFSAMFDGPSASESSSAGVSADVAEDRAEARVGGEDSAGVAAKVPEKQKPEGAKGEPAKKAEKQPPVEADHEQDEDEHVPDDVEMLKRSLAAARGDKRKARKKWREAEQALSEFKGRYEAYRQQATAPRQEPQAPVAQKPAPWDLTEDEFLLNGPSAVKRYVGEQVSAVREEYQARKLDESEYRARQRYDNFDHYVEVFKQSASPEIKRRMFSDFDPAEFVVQYAKNFEAFSGVSSADEYREKVLNDERERMREEVRAEMLKEFGQSNGDGRQAPTPPPRSLAAARGAGVGKTPQWTGPRPFADLFR